MKVLLNQEVVAHASNLSAHKAEAGRSCSAREMLVSPKKTDRSQSDATHSRVFILFEIAQAHPPTPPPTHPYEVFGGRGALNVCRVRLYSKQQAGSTRASVSLESYCDP